MKRNHIWVPERIHTRKIDRGVARVNMKKSGHVQVCKHSKGHKSWFSGFWRNFART